ncbi:SpoIIE family protein phosphatase [candidate division KSB1 bacterium]|jgi:sigma-B regulation protein RsbU (phosphoserine phosphatase)|nr:SpoIIE family protein phosphatase [candidate division KSB1 bacterium]
MMNNDLSRELDQRLVELQSLFELSKVLNSSLNLSAILNNLLLSPMGRMMITRGMVLISDQDDCFEIQVVKGVPKDLIGQTFALSVPFESPVTCKQLPDSIHRLKTLFLQYEIELVIPINTSTRTVGLVALGKKISQIAFQEAELEYLDSMANIAATSIDNALMFKKLKIVNRRLDKKYQELNTLFDISKEFNATLDKDKIVNLLIYAIMGEMVVSRCFVFLNEANQLELAAYRGLEIKPQDLHLLASQDLLNHLSRLSAPMRIQKNTIPKDLKPLVEQNFDIAVPMRHQEETKGVILIGEKINKQDYQDDELEFLATLGNQAAISLENVYLFQETLDKQIMEEEMKIARDIQKRLLPDKEPELASLDIKGLNIPSRQVGGDYYDCMILDNNHVALTVADVSGKGVGASLLMANLQASIKSLANHHDDLGKMVALINNIIHANTGFDKFITFFYSEIDLENRTLTYINAGHNPPYLFHENGEFEILDVGGLLLGMMPDMPYESATVPIRKNDVLVMFTDGVTEAKNAQDEEFEEWRLEELLAKNLDQSMSELVESILLEMKKFSGDEPQADDITLLAAKVMD